MRHNRRTSITPKQLEQGAWRLLKVCGLLSLTVLSVTAASLGLIKVFNYSKETQFKASIVDNAIAPAPTTESKPPKVVVVTNYVHAPRTISIEEYLDLGPSRKYHRKGVVYTSEQLANFDDYLRSRGIDPEIRSNESNSTSSKPLSHKQKLKKMYQEGKINYFMP